MNYLKGSFRSLELVNNVEIQNEFNPLQKDALTALI
jgi:hypothetical protein